MRRLLRFVSAAGFAALLAGLVAQPVAAADAPAPAQPAGPTRNLSQLDQQLTQQQQKLDQLTNDVKRAEGIVLGTSKQLEADQSREAELLRQMQVVARIEYQRPALSLSNILQAHNLDQLISSMAQAKLVATKEQTLHAQAKQLREKDAAARSQATAQLAKITADRNQAAQVVQETQATVQAAQAEAGRAAQAAQAQSVASRAQSLNQVAQTAAAAPGSIQQIIVQAFQPQGQAAVDWGLRIAKCESGYNPNAVNPSGASGLFQFMPSTFANSPPGRAGGSIWDPVANSQAAAWMYSQGRQGEWQCN
jgi:hypothetical protein